MSRTLQERVSTFENPICPPSPNGFWSLLKPKSDPRWVPALTSHKSIVVDGDYVYLVGGTSFSVDSSHKFISVLYLGSGDIPAWDLPQIVEPSASTTGPVPRYGHSASLYK